eukprot:gnl/Spiro4/23068_TR11402_c0_g1_i1.p1 gnl/Spiro4/23068_TR11402_c0_g1~~gnl/Spiro4/23068_TR11402_c0_g1_i1.p1  ORF type:complete len:804 (-),score=207.48 gnl/Spiro4/23068_TR11402_c0_g1_i1:121-2532(-)
MQPSPSPPPEAGSRNGGGGMKAIMKSIGSKYTSSFLIGVFSFLIVVACVMLSIVNSHLRNQIASLQAQNAELLLKNDFLKEQFKKADREVPALATEQVEEDSYAGLLGLLAFLCATGYAVYVIAMEVYQARQKVERCSSLNICVMDVLMYRIDYWFSVSPMSKPIALLVVTMALICVGGFIYSVCSGESVAASVWASWVFISDTGAHSDESRPLARFVALVVTIGGMLVFGIMVGIVSDTIGEKVESLKKGKSKVIEVDHTLILGWSDKVIPIIREIAIANESEGGGVIVVMADRDKEAMELEIMESEGVCPRGTQIVVRSGNPIVSAELVKVSALTAKSIIILADRSEGTDADQSDARALRCVMSVKGLTQDGQYELRGHMVVELLDVDNRELVTLVSEKAVIVVSHDVVGRLILQSTLQPGLALVLESLLGFDGCEFYIKEWPSIVGLPFEQVHYYFPDAIPVGVMPRGGVPILNPEPKRLIAEGDQLIVIAEDNDTYAPTETAQHTPASNIPIEKILSVSVARQPKKMLFVGFRRDLDDIIMELDNCVGPGTELTLFNSMEVMEREQLLREGGLNVDELENLTLTHVVGNPVLRRHLEQVPIHAFNSVTILAEEKYENDMSTADSRSLASLLLIRDIQAKAMERMELERTERVERGEATEDDHQPHWIDGKKNPMMLISEILDSRTKTLVSVANVSDYVASNELVSKVIAMISEQWEVNLILSELLTAEGNETYLRDALIFVEDGEELCFWDITSRCNIRREICIGYKKKDSEEVVLNPPDKKEIIKWVRGDIFVTIADN